MNESLRDTLLSFLNAHQISYERYDHPPVHTCEAAALHTAHLPGVSTKNLFLCDELHSSFYLVSVADDHRVDLKALSQLLSVKRMTFGTPEEMREVLYLTPGSVTMLSLHMQNASRVTLVIDERLWNSELLQCHPMLNTGTLVLTQESFRRYLTAVGVAPRVVAVPEKKAS